MPAFYFPFTMYLQQDQFLYSIKPIKVFRTKLNHSHSNQSKVGNTAISMLVVYTFKL